MSAGTSRANSIASMLPILLVVALAAWALKVFMKRQSQKQTSGAATAMASPPSGNAMRGLVLSIAGGAIGLMAGYLTRPYTESDAFLTQGQANAAIQAVGTHMLIFIAGGLVVGLAAHFLMPATSSKP